MEQNTSALAYENWHALTPAEVAAPRAWFVESVGSYVGPMEIGELERMWHTGEISEHTLVWAEGMLEWQALGDVPDLLYLAIEPPAAAAPPAPEPAWTAANSEVTSLATLVQSELQAIVSGGSQPVAVRAAPSDLPAIEALAASDPFSRWWTERRRPADATAWSADPWQTRMGGLKTGRKLPVILGLVTGAAAVAVVALALQVAGVIDIGRLTLGSVVRSSVAAAAPLTAVSAPGAVAPAASAVVAPTAANVVPAAAGEAALAPIVAKPAADPDPQAESQSAEREPAVRDPVAREPARPAARPKHEIVAKIAAPAARAEATEEPAERPAAAASARAKQLSPQEVIETTKAQIRSLAPCVQRAREGGEIEDKRYTFILDWRIRADGGVAEAKLKGPAEVAGTSLSPCFAAAMRQWHYRPSAEEFTVANFPLPVTVH